MTYIPNRSLRKAIASVRINHTGSGNADLTLDTGTPSAITFSIGSWTEIFASTGETVRAIEIFDATGEIALVASGAAASEVVEFRVIPGGNGLNYFQIDETTRVSLRYESTLPAANSDTVINFYR